MSIVLKHPFLEGNTVPEFWEWDCPCNVTCSLWRTFEVQTIPYESTPTLDSVRENLLVHFYVHFESSWTLPVHPVRADDVQRGPRQSTWSHPWLQQTSNKYLPGFIQTPYLVSWDWNEPLTSLLPPCPYTIRSDRQRRRLSNRPCLLPSPAVVMWSAQ